MRPHRAAPLLAIATLLAAPAVASAEVESTTTINGEVPPGTAAKLAELTVVTDTVGVDGNRLLVRQGIRKAGTRAPIQYHDYGSRMCVTAGTMTHFVEGADPAIYPSGSCYDMPANTVMTAANLGDEDALLVMTFNGATKEPTTIVLEPNWPDLTDPTG